MGAAATTSRMGGAYHTGYSSATICPGANGYVALTRQSGRLTSHGGATAEASRLALSAQDRVAFEVLSGIITREL